MDGSPKPDDAARARNRARWMAWDLSRPCPWWGWPILIAGAPGMVAAGGLLYGGSAARRGSVGDTLMVAVFLGVGMALVIVLCRCRRTLVTMPIAMVAGMLVIPVGHVVGYSDATNMAAAYFEAHPEDLPADAKGRPDALFPAYVEVATGTRGNTFFSYLRLQLSIGAETRRVTRGYGSYTITVSGLEVLLMWALQLLLFPVAAGVGVVAATPGFNDDPPAGFRVPQPIKSR